jgi:hypothetical protein
LAGLSKDNKAEYIFYCLALPACRQVGSSASIEKPMLAIVV